MSMKLKNLDQVNDLSRSLEILSGHIEALQAQVVARDHRGISGKKGLDIQCRTYFLPERLVKKTQEFLIELFEAESEEIRSKLKILGVDA